MSEHDPLPEAENIYDTQCPILYEAANGIELAEDLGSEG